MAGPRWLPLSRHSIAGAVPALPPRARPPPPPPERDEPERRPRRPQAPPQGPQEAASLRELLERVPVQHVALSNWLRKSLVLLNAGQTLERALNRFNVHAIRSLPIADPSRAVIGLLDLRALLDVLAESVGGQPRLGRLRVDFLSRSVQSVLAQSPRQAHLIAAQTSLAHCLEYLAHSNVGRLLVVERDLAGTVQPQSAPERDVTACSRRATCCASSPRTSPGWGPNRSFAAPCARWAWANAPPCSCPPRRARSTRSCCCNAKRSSRWPWCRRRRGRC